ncbi:hypothetical protein [Massilia aerilata]|uniref:M28 family peptidase n=1 Tax=Massilia aerilata TaxID=453817 RepID=A0ABW0RWN9_9BURK
MRTFLRSHWKVLVAIIVLVLLALFTVTPGAAEVAQPSLALRLRAHAAAIASGEDDTARYIEGVLQGEGYAVRRQAYRAGARKVRNIEVSVTNPAPHAKPARIFIVGARYGAAPLAAAASDRSSGAAAVLELARLLKDLHPSQGTEVKFVFFVDQTPSGLEGEDLGSAGDAGASPVLAAVGWYSLRQSRKQDAARTDSGNFIAFVGTLEASRLVQDALSAFRAVSDFPAHGLAAPAYVQGVTFLDRAAARRFGYPAIMITDTAFMRYPYYHMREETPDQPDAESTARVVRGLARTITRLASGAQS